MNIVSYRGPGMAGGVSSALLRLCEKQEDSQCSWWHLKDSNVSLTNALSKEQQNVTRMNQDIVQGHYRYCNEFLWPVMHDMSEYASYSSNDRRSYQAFNNILATAIGRSSQSTELEVTDTHFVQDYQLAMLPALLSAGYGIRTGAFWHIPWPKNVRPLHVLPIREIASGLLRSRILGFHTEEYAGNFVEFVEEHIPNFHLEVKERSQSIFDAFLSTSAAGKNVRRIIGVGDKNHPESTATEIVVRPLGVDATYWQELAASDQNIFADPRFSFLADKPYILSVDRADYTKGVKDRLEIIRMFFAANPQWMGKVTFLQLCGKTRCGLKSFDTYWNKCKLEGNSLLEQFGTDQWQPVVWMETPVFPKDLALLYKHAAVMLVNPIRDGLNLTAKEFVVCQQDNPGVLLLSKGAGAWHEFQHFSLPIDPLYPEQVIAAIKNALTMPEADRALRISCMKALMSTNTLESWWQYFYTRLSDRERIFKYKLSYS